MLSLVIVLFSNWFAATDSMVPDVPVEINFSAVETMTLSYSYEILLAKLPHYSMLLSGGPLLYSDSFFDSQLFCLGVDAEIRRYKAEGYSGFFIAGATKVAFKWAGGDDMIQSINTGLKLGWKCNLKNTGVQIDLEPSFSAGLVVYNVEEAYLELGPDAYIGLGLGLAIH